jgi:hypothetical protein
VPSNITGKLAIVTSFDLGTMGAKDGPAVEYNWVWAAPVLSGFRSEANDGSAADNNGFPPGGLPWVPWLVIFGLLALKPNRRPAAWLIWLPLGCATAFTLVLPSIPPSGSDFLQEAIVALAFGLAAVWLLSNYLRRSRRRLTFLCFLLALAGFSELSAMARQNFSLATDESSEISLLLALAVPASAVALSLAGRICRGRYRPAGLYLWLLVWLAATWLVIAAPFFLSAAAVSSNSVPWSDFFIPVLAVAAGNFAVLLSFLILSWANPFYRERLKTLLHIQSEALRPLSAPVMAANLKT